jgi:capsule polysaccharide export protein KpsE/RkpR
MSTDADVRGSALAPSYGANSSGRERTELSLTGSAPVHDTPPEMPGKGRPEESRMAEPIHTQQSLVPYLQAFWANRRLLLRTGVFAILASAFIAVLIPARYQSVTRLMPPDGHSGSGLGLLAAMAGRTGTGGFAVDLLGAKSFGALFVGILNCDTVQDRLIDEFQLKQVYHASKIEDARQALAEHTEASEDRKSGIISIAVTDHDPRRAAAMARAYVAELDRLVAQVSTSSARRERIFLEGHLQKVKADLDTAARNFSDFASQNTAIDIPAQGRAMVEAAARLQGQLIAAQAELSGLQQIYTGDQVRVRAAGARVKELQKKLSEIGGAGTQRELRSDMSLYPSIRKLPLLGVTYADLYRQTKIQETVYEVLTQQYESAKVQEAREIPAVEVLDAAMVPTKKSFPHRTVIVVVGTLLGIALAMTWIVGKTRWNALDANDPGKALATEVFTTVQARVPRFSRNGTGADVNEHRPWILWKKTETSNAEKREGEEREEK